MDIIVWQQIMEFEYDHLGKTSHYKEGQNHNKNRQGLFCIIITQPSMSMMNAFRTAREHDSVMRADSSPEYL